VSNKTFVCNLLASVRQKYLYSIMQPGAQHRLLRSPKVNPCLRHACTSHQQSAPLAACSEWVPKIVRGRVSVNGDPLPLIVTPLVAPHVALTFRRRRRSSQQPPHTGNNGPRDADPMIWMVPLHRGSTSASMRSFLITPLATTLPATNAPSDRPHRNRTVQPVLAPSGNCCTSPAGHRQRNLIRPTMHWRSEGQASQHSWRAANGAARSLSARAAGRGRPKFDIRGSL
jgi:hypothetical protein